MNKGIKIIFLLAVYLILTNFKFSQDFPTLVANYPQTKNKFTALLTSDEKDPESSQNPDSIENEEDSDPELQKILDMIKESRHLESQNSQSPKDTFYFKIIKGFDLFGETVRNLLKNYIVSIDPEDLFINAIQGITLNLDPYTYFYLSQGDLDEAIARDSYVGLGVVVSLVDSSLMIVDFSSKVAKDSSNLRIGDIIIAVDSVKLVPNLDTLRKYTSGKPNTAVKVKIYRESTQDTLIINTTRREIPLPSLSGHYEFEDEQGKILYIQVQRFDSELPDKFKEIVTHFLATSGKKAGLIIDLRDNPGGTLESAVLLAEMFLPSGRTIVTVKGQNPYSFKEYKAVYSPLDTILPLVLMVNSGSASASEVLAGALQDNDRAVIIGEQTFGKGVIQNIISLPYDSYLKITTAKFFTPSGRCIHRTRYNNMTAKQIDNIFHDQTEFQTLNKRQVFDTSGITPDFIIPRNQKAKFIAELEQHQFFLRFAAHYTSTNKINQFDFYRSNQKQILNEFIQFLQSKGFNYKTKAEIFLDSAISNLIREQKKSQAEELIKLRSKFKNNLKKLCSEYQNEILTEIETAIYKQVLDFDEFKKYVLEKDIYLIKSKELILNPEVYQMTISTSSRTIN